jgi:hypothetical protein
MVCKNSKKLFSIFFVALLAFTLFLPLATPTRAADHAESTSVGGDPNADIADVFAFLDPNDNSKVILAIDVAGFIVPSELLNLSFFPPETIYQFQIENTGDARPDMFIDVTFSAQTSRSSPQTATVRFSNGITFTAPTTVQTQRPTPNPFVVTTEPRRKISFYAGLTDDPFFFDIVGFNRFTDSVFAGNPDPTRLQRARDSFAGYNIHMIALSVPASLLRGNSDVIGINGVTLKNQTLSVSPTDGTITGTGPLVQIDRMATPVVNTVFIPFPRKNEYNSSTPQDDANGRFAADIISTAQRLGVNQTNIDILANLAVVRGDYLRLNLTTPNTSLGDGEDVTAPGFTGFPNGRRPGDDTIDTALFFVANQTRIGDGVPTNDRRFLSTFPFFAPPHQPLENPQVDNTQN